MDLRFAIYVFWVETEHPSTPIKEKDMAELVYLAANGLMLSSV